MNEINILAKIIEVSPIGGIIAGLYIFHRLKPPKNGKLDIKALGREIRDGMQPVMDRLSHTLEKTNDRSIEMRTTLCSNHENIKQIGRDVQDVNTGVTAILKTMPKRRGNGD